MKHLSQLTPIQQRELIARIAKAIAKTQGWNFSDVDICEYASINPRAAEYVRAAESALQEIKDFCQ
ncbi:MAG: hypothetical protein KME10_19095 [Plectolyngbya sp. WJT66-NPBG17]|jgi:adenylosuccinate synthase|nr:hypothetical protein [Plectolyngbya sp. WJT66-NPBG17]